MKCKYHSKREAVGKCRKCSADVCQSCLVDLGGLHLCKPCQGMDPGSEVQVRTVTVQSQSVVMGPRGMEVVDTDAHRLRCPKCGSKLQRIPTPSHGMGPTMTEYKCLSCNTRYSRLMGTMTADDGSTYVSPELARAVSEVRSPTTTRRSAPSSYRPSRPAPRITRHQPVSRPVNPVLSYLSVVGMILLMIAAPIYCVIYYLYREMNLFVGQRTFFWSTMVLLAIVIGIGAVLAAFTHYSFHRKFNSSPSWYAFILSLILPWFLAIINGVTLVDIDLPSLYVFGVTTRFLIWFIALLLFGVVLMFWGLSWLSIHNKTKDSGLAKASGALFFIAGLCYCVLIAGVIEAPDIWKIIYFQAGAFLLIPASVLAMIVLLTNPEMK